MNRLLALKKIEIIIILFFILNNCYCQYDTLVIYYPYTDILDISLANSDTLIKDSISDSYYGEWDNKINLNLELPDSIAQSQSFTNNKFVPEDFDMLSFPIRVNVGLFTYGYTNNARPYGSGVFVSPNAVLTAGHVICKDATHVHFGKILQWKENIAISPAFANGNPQGEVGIFKVHKCYLFKNFTNSFGNDRANDMALLILDEPIGYKIGWLGIGYSESHDFFLTNVFYNFSYPGTNGFDGHNMVYKYGKFMYSSDNFSFSDVTGIPGESGSGFFLWYKNHYRFIYLAYKKNISHHKQNY